MSSEKFDTEKSAPDFYPGSSSPDPGHGDVIADHGAESGLQRRLGTRHITMIALGSSIGMGLWLGSGTSLIDGGPAAMFIGCRLPMLRCLRRVADLADWCLFALGQISSPAR